MVSTSKQHPHTEASLWAMLLLSASLLLLCGVGLAIFQYQQHSRIILSAGDALFSRISQQLEQDLLNLYRPPVQALNLLALSSLSDSSDLEERLVHLPKMASVLSDNPQLNSLYHGWNNGDYMMLRPLRDSSLRSRFEAPDKADWMVWHIKVGDEQRQTLHLFLDDQLQLLERRRIADDGYDPRSRLWFRQARESDGQIITTPYIFFSTSEFGTTLARPAGPDAVVGADLTLGQLSQTLSALQITDSSELLVYDGQGTVIAYQDLYRILNAAHGSALRLKRFNELGSTLLARLAEDGYRIERQTRLVLEGQRWTVSQRRIDLHGVPDIYLAILVPEAELLTEAYRIRTQSLWITLVTSLILLPLFWLAARGALRRRHDRSASN